VWFAKFMPHSLSGGAAMKLSIIEQIICSKIHGQGACVYLSRASQLIYCGLSARGINHFAPAAQLKREKQERGAVT
jgi:hypothetical protein